MSCIGIMTVMPASHEYRGRRAAVVENDGLRLTVLEEGGHIAEIFDKRSGVNPLWTPPWASIEPSTYSRTRHPEYGDGSDAMLLAGIMGHSLCVDIFGGPSGAEAAAGITPHGEASVVKYELNVNGEIITAATVLPCAGLRVEREIALVDRTVRIRESIENLTACDRPIGWTQHVTLGPPFLENGLTEFRASATRSKVYEHPFGVADDLAAAASFDWPFAPRAAGGVADLRRFIDATPSSAYTAHLMSSTQKHAFFVAFSPRARLAFGYVWTQEDFPWLGIWRENRSRTQVPWNGATIACGMEFGASPMPETRREMIDRGRLFDTPTFRWIPAKARVEVTYWAIAHDADVVPEMLSPTA
jgi:hypothetical protein